MTDTEKYLAEVRERAEKATRGPWGWDDGAVLCGEANNKAHSGFGFSSIPAQYHHGDEYQTPNGVDSDRDAEFIAHARTDIPQLLKLIAERDAEIIRLRSVTYVGGVISVGGHPIADHSELPKENQRLFEQVDRLRKQLEVLNRQRDGYRHNYWQFCKPCAEDMRQIIEDDLAELDRLEKE